MVLTANPTGGVEVFCSYTHKDKKLRDELERHLSILKRQGLIAIWHDRNISAGMEWKREINEHLNTASIILLLISPDFLASDYCYCIEMEQALDRHQAGEARVIPILLRVCDWKSTPLHELKTLPSNARPVAKWPNHDDAFLDIVEGIRQAVQSLYPKPLIYLPPAFPNIWNVPHAHNPFFTGREDILKRLYNELSASKTGELTQPCAISGLSGIGKTQIAVEYAYRYRSNYEVVLWANADSHKTLTTDFVIISRLLNLSEKHAQDQSLAVEAVKRWLERNTNWLLIIDNADDMEMVKDFLPKVSRGYILLTTTAQAMGRIARRIEVDKMEPGEGALFLLRRANFIAPDAKLKDAKAVHRNKAREIAVVMGGLPLALDQAGAYIEETACGLAGYLERYQMRQTELLNRRGRFASDHPEPVATTWSLSIERTSSEATELLRFCAFLYPDAIPKELIEESALYLGSILQPVALDILKLDTAIDELRKFSLLERDPDTQTLTIHRLVQAVIKDGMNEETQRRWIERTIHAVNRVFPHVEFATWQRCEIYLPHARICAEYIEQRGIDITEAAQLLHNMGHYLQERAQYLEVEPLYIRARAIWEKALGPGDPHVAACLNNLAILREIQGRYAEAESLYQQALQIYTKSPGSDDLNVAASLNNLATLYEVQGKYNEAARFYQQALDMHEKTLGPDHPDVATSLNNLAEIYRIQNKYDQAESLYRRSLTICEKALGPEHPHVATSLNNLALLYYAQGQYTLAEKYLARSLKIREKALGIAHPDVATSLNNLGLLYYAQGQYQRAGPFFLRALDIRKKTLGPEHLDLAASLNNLAMLHYAQGVYINAEPLFIQALEIRERNLGPEHTDVAATLSNLALLYSAQGEYSRAEEYLKRALAIREKILGIEHPDTATSLDDLASLYYAQGEYTQAQPLYQQALVIRQKILGLEHPEIVKSLNNLAVLYYTQGEYVQAEQLYQQIQQSCEQTLGKEHPAMIRCLNNLAVLYYTQGQYARAEQLYQQIQQSCEQTLGKEHPAMIRCLNNLAVLYYSQGKYIEAKQFYERSKHICEQVLGKEHADVAISLNNLAILHHSRGEYAQAELLYGESQDIRGKRHPDATTLNNLAQLHYSHGEYLEAELLHKQALEIWEKHLGLKPLNTTASLNNLAMIYQTQGRYDEAERLYKRALDIFRTNEHPYMVIILHNLALLYATQGQYAQAAACYLDALGPGEKSLGTNHPYLATLLKNYASLLRKTGQEIEATSLEERAGSIWTQHTSRNLRYEE